MKSSIIKTGTMLAGFLLAACLSTHAEVKLPAIFSDGMMMQQQTNANLWGTATPHKKVTVTTSWNGKQYAATADKNGAWKLTVATPEAGGPYTVTFDDGTQKTLNNILIGELWLCSGQSNMEMPMKGFKNQPVENANMDILHSKNPQIRLFTVKRTSTFTPQNDVIGSWKEATPASVRDFSATAYYFGRLVNEILDVPVGLVVAAWGGSACEAWMTADWLKAFPSPGSTRHRQKAICAGRIISPSPVPTAAGRWPFSTGPGRTCWRWTCAWTPPVNPSLCWTTR